MLTLDRLSKVGQKLADPFLKATPKQRLRWLVITALLAGAAVTAEVWVYQNYRIAWDRQVLKCLDAHLLLVSLNDKTIERDGIYTYLSEQAEPVIKNGTQMGKILRGLPGDTVEIRPDETVLINGKVVSEGMPHLVGMTDAQRSKFFGRRVLKDDEYWVMGTARLSFDSRYWGPIHKHQFVGRAYALF